MFRDKTFRGSSYNCNSILAMGFTFCKNYKLLYKKNKTEQKINKRKKIQKIKQKKQKTKK